MFSTSAGATRYVQARKLGNTSGDADLLAALRDLMPSGFQDGPPDPNRRMTLTEARAATGGLADELLAKGFIAMVDGTVRITSQAVNAYARSLAHRVMPPAGRAGRGAVARDAEALSSEPIARARLLATRTVRTWYQRGGKRIMPLLRSHRRYSVPPARNTVATAVLVDCSHSMILYGEDRFTPAKELALALAGLIERDFPTDELYVITFHNDATLMPLPEFAMQRIGPWFTNTAAGLERARSVLRRSSAAGKHIVLLTDGKPSMITLPSGNTYQNSYGIDPQIRRHTLLAAQRCAHDGISFTSVMIAQDELLRSFMRDFTRVTHGTLHELAPRQLEHVLVTWQDKRYQMMNVN